MRTLLKDLQILVVEDNPGDFVLIEEYLAEMVQNSEIKHVKTYEEAKNALQSDTRFDVVLLDLSLPDLSGEALINNIVENAGEIPVVVLTGYESQEFGLKTLGMGIADYLLKDEITPFMLGKMIAYGIERNRFKQTLQKSEKKYRDIFNMSPQPMYLVDMESLTVLDVNEAAVNQYGYEKEEFLNLHIFDLRPEEQIPLLEKELERAKNNQSTFYETILRHRKKSGEIFDAKISTSVVHRAGKNLRMVLAEDITHKIEAERAIAQKTRFLAANAEVATALIKYEDWLSVLNQTFKSIGAAVDVDRVYYFENHKDHETGELLASQKIEWAANRVEPQFHNPGLQNLVHSQYSELFSVLKKNETYNGLIKDLPDCKFKRSLESQDILSVLVVPIFLGEIFHGVIGFDDCTNERLWSDEEIRYLQTIASNIASAIRLRKTTSKLQSNEQRFRSIVQDGSDLIAILDENAMYQYVSPNIQEVMGIPYKELLGNNVFEYIHEDDRELITTLLKNLSPGERKYIPPFRIKFDDSKWSWVETTVVNLLDNPAINGYLANSRDVTEKIKYQNEIQSSLAEKETLLAEIHHRVKNNLAIVSGMMQLQAFGTENEELQDKLSDSVFRIKTMATVHELLYQSDSFSKLEFSETMEKLVENVGTTLNTKSEIELDIQCDKVTLNINQAIPASLVVNEVITNAYKHAFKNKNKGCITFKLTEKNEQIEIKIIDDGIGISEENLSNSKSLGMHLIQVLCDQLNAGYEYKSHGNGTIFSITFKKEDKKSGIGSARMF